MALPILEVRLWSCELGRNWITKKIFFANTQRVLPCLKFAHLFLLRSQNT